MGANCFFLTVWTMFQVVLSRMRVAMVCSLLVAAYIHKYIPLLSGIVRNRKKQYV